MIKEFKLKKETKEKLKYILKQEKSVYLEDAKDALKSNEELSGKEAIKRYNQWKKSQSFYKKQLI